MPYPATDGESIVIMSDIKSLLSLGHKVFVFCINTKKHFVDTANYDKLPFWTDFKASECNTNGFMALIKGVFSSNPLQLSRFFTKEIASQIQQFTIQNKIETVIYQGLAMTQYLSNQSNLLKLYRAHNLEHTIWARMAANSSHLIKKLFYNTLSASLTRFELKELYKLDYFICLNESEANYFADLYQKPTKTISISIDNPSEKLYSEESKGLLFVGSLDWQPNRQALDWFLEEVYSNLNDIPLTIAGKGDFKVSKYHNVKLISNFDKIEDLFSSHRLMIVPLFSGGGIRIKILEAMQFGMPVISTGVGAEGIIDNSNSVFYAEDSREWIDKINEIYHSKSTLKIMSENLKLNYRLNYSSQRIKSLWESVII